MKDFVLSRNYYTDKPKIDSTRTIEQSAKNFIKMEAALVELIKNEKDHGLNVGNSEIPIVVICSTTKNTLGVIGANGATSDIFNGWEIWSNDNAKGKKVEGVEKEYGNGGKCALAECATIAGHLSSCVNNKWTWMGFDNQNLDRKYVAAYYTKDGVDIKDTNCDNLDVFSYILRNYFDIEDTSNFPPSLLEAILKNNAHTIATMEGPRDMLELRSKNKSSYWRSNLPKMITRSKQSLISLRYADIYVIIDGELYSDKPLKPSSIPHMEEFKNMFEYKLPDEYIDPVTGSTCEISNNENDYLKIGVSKSSFYGANKIKNELTILNTYNVVAIHKFNDFKTNSPYCSFLYGELKCSSLTDEHLSGNDRRNLSDTPKVRALMSFCEEKTIEITKAIEKVRSESVSQDEYDKVANNLSQMRDLMKSYLPLEKIEIVTDDEDDSPGKKGLKKDAELLQLEWKSPHGISLSSDTTVPYEYRFLATDENGKLVKAIPQEVKLHSYPEGIVLGNYDSTLSSVKPGTCEIWLESENGLTSERVPVRVIIVDDVEISPRVTKLLRNERALLPVTAYSSDKAIGKMLFEIVSDKPELLKPGRNGSLIVGDDPGEVKISVFYSGCRSKSVTFTILEESKDPPNKKKEIEGVDLPIIKLCDKHNPDSHPGGPDFLTTISNDPEYPNTTWINPYSYKSLHVRRKYGSQAGAPCSISSPSYLEFLGLQFYDILLNTIALRKLGLSETEVKANHLLAELEGEKAEANLECHGFLDAVSKIARSIAT